MCCRARSQTAVARGNLFCHSDTGKTTKQSGFCMYMTVKDLKELIEHLPDNMEIKIRALGGELREPIEPEVVSAGDDVGEEYFLM